MIKLIAFIFSLLTAQNLYNGQINFNYSGTENGSFNSLFGMLFWLTISSGQPGSQKGSGLKSAFTMHSTWYPQP